METAAITQARIVTGERISRFLHVCRSTDDLVRQNKRVFKLSDDQS